MVFTRIGMWAAGLVLVLGSSIRAADVAVLGPENFEEMAPGGKEADAIYGDYVLRNDRIVAVVANPIKGRNANMTVREVGGALIDLTLRGAENDQLSAWYPGAQQVLWSDPKASVGEGVAKLVLSGVVNGGGPRVELTYSLRDGEGYVDVRTRYTNPTAEDVEVELADTVRADRSFEVGADKPEGGKLFWVEDFAFGQAYGVSPVDHGVMVQERGRTQTVRYLAEGKARIGIGPGGEHVLTRRIIPGGDTLALRGLAEELEGGMTREVRVEVVDGEGNGLEGAEIVVERGGEQYGRTKSGGAGVAEIRLPTEGKFRLMVGHPASQEGRGVDVPEAGEGTVRVELPSPGWAAALVVGEDGGGIPCKVQFIGNEGTADPDFGPDSGEHGVKNCYYSHDGVFTQRMKPGTYQVIISRGPEYDAVFMEVKVESGKETALAGTLKRTVETPGWVSTDYHSHSSPSGDNTSSQYGRVLNLLCEHVEFAPCTEHNRLSSYAPHLERLGAADLMGTCVGLELTGGPLPLNHQNVFPMNMTAGVQDNGAPLTDVSPEVQIERLAMWENSAEKLVQVNHPDLGWMFYDANGDGTPDEGLRKMAGLMDVVEVHPPEAILRPAVGPDTEGKLVNNTIGNWLQLLNQGYRIPGVVNTDAHYNFHGSGWLRNYVKSPTDAPGEIQALDMVRASEAGQIIMSNGPYMEVTLRSGDQEATAGGDLRVETGEAKLHVRVQCPNWLDIDRVQVLRNGLADESLNFTRSANPGQFGDGVVKFDQKIPVAVKRDEHLIVVAIGEGSGLGPVMGPDHAETPPVAVSNPIFLDADGGGFAASKDTLGVSLPVKSGVAAQK